jgi:hypothetical protein
MVDEPKPKAAKKKKRRRTPPEEFITYVVEIIVGWDWAYSFSLDTSKHPDDPYHEFRHLVITGKPLRPAGLKTDAVEVTLLCGAASPPFSKEEPMAATKKKTARGRKQDRARVIGRVGPEVDVGRGLLSGSRRLRIHGFHECRCARFCDGRAVFFVHVTDPAGLDDKVATTPGALLLQEHKLFRLLFPLCNAEWRKC